MNQRTLSDQSSSGPGEYHQIIPNCLCVSVAVIHGNFSGPGILTITVSIFVCCYNQRHAVRNEISISSQVLSRCTQCFRENGGGEEGFLSSIHGPRTWARGYASPFHYTLSLSLGLLSMGYKHGPVVMATVAMLDHFIINNLFIP
jgi:hypothetical protein